jgi:hypothetical protein
MVNGKPASADLKDAIVALGELGFGIESTLMLGSLVSTFQPGTLPSSRLAKYGFSTRLLGSAHAASISGWVAGSPERRRRDSSGGMDMLVAATGAATVTVCIMVVGTAWVCTTVVVTTWVLIVVESSVIKMGAVAHTQGVVLFSKFVGVPDGKEEFLNGAVGVRVEFSDGLGVAEGTLVMLAVDCIAGSVEFKRTLTVAAVKPLLETVVELPNGGMMIDEPVGGLDVTLPDREGKPEDGVTDGV